MTDSTFDYSVIWLLGEENPRIVATKWIRESEDNLVYCYLPSGEDKIKFYTILTKLKDYENFWSTKVVKEIKYQTST